MILFFFSQIQIQQKYLVLSFIKGTVLQSIFVSYKVVILVLYICEMTVVYKKEKEKKKEKKFFKVNSVVIFASETMSP